MVNRGSLGKRSKVEALVAYYRAWRKHEGGKEKKFDLNRH